MFAELAFAFVYREVRTSSFVSDGGSLKRKPGNYYRFMFSLSFTLAYELHMANMFFLSITLAYYRFMFFLSITKFKHYLFLKRNIVPRTRD